MSPEQQRERQREKSRAHYQKNREAILERQRQERLDAVAGEALRERERERKAALPEEERERQRERTREWYRRNPRSSAENAKLHMRFRYGLSPEQRTAMITAQDGCCYLCNEPLDLANPRKVHVDHDHSCCRGSRSCGSCIRGIACDPCNRGIGYFRDDPERMRRVADNLEMAGRLRERSGQAVNPLAVSEQPGIGAPGQAPEPQS